jgi:hypothetical protein
MGALNQRFAWMSDGAGAAHHRIRLERFAREGPNTHAPLQGKQCKRCRLPPLSLFRRTRSIDEHAIAVIHSPAAREGSRERAQKRNDEKLATFIPAPKGHLWDPKGHDEKLATFIPAPKGPLWASKRQFCKPRRGKGPLRGPNWPLRGPKGPRRGWDENCNEK